MSVIAIIRCGEGAGDESVRTYLIPTEEADGFHGTVSVVSFPHATSYTDRMKALTLTLQWETQNITRTRVLTTYIAKDGIQNYVY